MSDKMSIARKALMWWFRWPGNPYVCVTAAVDFSGARDYLEQLNSGQGARVSVNHLVVAAVARVLHEFPEANAWIVGKEIRRQQHVGVAMPVDLTGSEAAGQQTSLAVVQDADTLTLRQVAEAGRREVTAERKGQHSNPVIRAISGAVERLPYGVLARGLDVAELAARHPLVSGLLQRQLGFTTVVTNAGAPFGKMDGMLFRGAAMELPQRLIHVGTVWGISAIQDEVLAIKGKAEVRPTMPVVMVFDHRLFDGVKAGRILVRLAQLIQDPASAFGADGDVPIGA